MDIINVKPFYGMKSFKVFEREPDVINTFYTYRGEEQIRAYTTDTIEGQFINFIDGLRPGMSFAKVLIEMSMKFPTIDRCDIYTFILLHKKCVSIMKKIYKIDKDTLLQTFPEIEYWLDGKNRKKIRNIY